jgi:hypothetical protein
MCVHALVSVLHAHNKRHTCMVAHPHTCIHKNNPGFLTNKEERKLAQAKLPRYVVALPQGACCTVWRSLTNYTPSCCGAICTQRFPCSCTRHLPSPLPPIPTSSCMAGGPCRQFLSFLSNHGRKC